MCHKYSPLLHSHSFHLVEHPQLATRASPSTTKQPSDRKRPNYPLIQINFGGSSTIGTTFEGPTTIKDMASPSASSSLLDKLPAELRNRVYHLVLTTAEPINFNSSNIKDRTALLQTCKQIRIEASQIFCASNRFDIAWRAGQKNHLLRWITSIDRTAALHLHLRIRFDISVWRMTAITRCGGHQEFRALAKKELLSEVRVSVACGRCEGGEHHH